MRVTPILCALAPLLAACDAASSQSPGVPSFGAETRALDGDTVAVDFRLLGVDALERGQLCARADGCWPCGKAAQGLAARAVRRTPATIMLTPTSSYGRPVAVVSVAGRDLGEMEIRAGFAVPAVRFLRQDPARAGRYLAAYAAAKRDRAGMHSGAWIDPGDWRRGARLQCER